MLCNRCKGLCIKKGKTIQDIQKYQCKSCKKYKREAYKRPGHKADIGKDITLLVKESCGIRSISRVLRISPTTVIRHIKKEADKIKKPVILLHKEYEADELKTFTRRKKNEQWVIYAIDRKTRQVADFRIGKRNKRNLKTVIDTLLFSKAKKIFTDRLPVYRSLIPQDIHKAVARHTNYIEHKNLNLRTHLKCLGRRTICFSKNVIMLEAIVKIYFWE